MDTSYLADSFNKFQSVSGTLQNSVYHALKDAIMQQKLPAEITEGQISLTLGVSRTPVREAMHKLSAEGFLEISHGKKAKVICITDQDIADISIVLRDLHKTSIELCVDRVTQEDLDQLKELLGLMEYYTAKQNFNQLVNYNTQFHLKICSFGHNKWLYTIMENLLNTSLVYRTHATARQGRAETGLKDHKKIYQMLCEREKQALIPFIEKHVNSAFERP